MLGIIIAAVSVLWFGLLILALYCNRRLRNKEVRADNDKLNRMAPRNCIVLQRHDQTQRRLRSQIKKLCKSRWHHKEYALNVINVSVVTNVAMRQRYERAYQAAQSLTPPSYSVAHSAEPPSYSTAQSAEPPSYLEAVNMAYHSPNDDLKQTSAVSSVTEFEPGVLREGEMHLFYQTNESHVKAVFESESAHAFSRNLYFGFAGLDVITLGEFSSYGQPTAGSDTKYMFVMRAIIDDPGPNYNGLSRTCRTSNLSLVIPEFLVSYKVRGPPKNNDRRRRHDDPRRIVDGEVAM